MQTLPMHKKIAYASGGLALNFINMLLSQWLLQRYIPPNGAALISPFLFFLIFFSGRFMDGVTDPIIGFLSDNLRTRFGRRIPFIALNVIPAGLATLLLFFPPDLTGMSVWNAVWLFVFIQLYFLFWTMLANPYQSLLPELTLDKKERIDIVTMQAVFIMLGTFLSAVIGNILQTAGWLGLGLTALIVTVLAFLPTLAFIKEKPLPENLVRVKFTIKDLFEWLKITFKNKPFIFFVISSSLYWFCMNQIIVMMPYWVQIVLKKTEGDVVLAMIPFLISNTIFFFLFNIYAKKLGKKFLLLFTYLGSALAVLSFLLVNILPIDSFVLTQISMFIFGIPVAGFLMLPNAILADIIDYDEKLTGMRREAMYFGTQALFQKIAIGFSIGTTTLLMFAGRTQNPNEFGLKLIVVVSALVSFVAYIIFRFYKLEEKMEKNT